MRSRSLVIVALFALMLFATFHPVFGNVFVYRHTGVSVGTWALYDSQLNDFSYRTKVTVTSVGATFYNLTIALYSANGTYIDAQSTGYSIYQSNMVPYWYIGAGLSGGDPIYAGVQETLSQSLLGHVVAGNHRQIVYADNTGVVGEVNHKEWDQATGMLTKFLFEDNGTGWSEYLVATNAWSSSSLWLFLGGVVPLFWFALPWVAAGSLLYFMAFFVVALRDWFHMRSLKAVRSGKMGGMMWFQIKIMIIASLIIMGILLGVLLLLSFALGH